MGRILLLLCVFIIACRSPKSDEVIEQVVGPIAQNGMVSCAHPLAAEVGRDILQMGGNAFDAAVAVHFALAVVYPGAGNIGGGGFAVLRTAEGQVSSIDFRETAPRLSSRDMFLDSSGNPLPMKSRLGHLSVGVPGSVDGMLQIHDSLGSLALEQLLQPAITLATKGFSLYKWDVEMLKEFSTDFAEVNIGPTPFTGKNWVPGDTLYLPELAETIKRISSDRRDGFYAGTTADLISAEMKKGNGLLDYIDLKGYRSIWRPVIKGDYRGYAVYCMGPPSSGGIALIQLLEGAELKNISSLGHNTVKTLHYITELERRVYADRASHLGDPDYYMVPQEQLLDPGYLKIRYSSINPDEATRSANIKEGYVEMIESTETTHFTVVDKNRNAVSVTTTLNGYFGSKVYVDGAGFLLNNQMDDFSIKPGVPNQFGLVGDSANAIEPGKRMLSSMTPTIVEKEGEFFLAIGTPGGSTIITSVFQGLMNIIDHEMTLQEAVDAPKMHHQWQPEYVLYDSGQFNALLVDSLRKMGHDMKPRGHLGYLSGVLSIENGNLEGAADSRGYSTAKGY